MANPNDMALSSDSAVASTTTECLCFSSAAVTPGSSSTDLRDARIASLEVALAVVNRQLTEQRTRAAIAEAALTSRDKVEQELRDGRQRLTGERNEALARAAKTERQNRELTETIAILRGELARAQMTASAEAA